ncbi:MAG TPA: helix-turn-helix domain-containing protein [Ktedonobacteraceae bacterium]|nr:helix-turn-helix domain-containing protein [Ktedonobacteraceae bacterium]
MQEHYEIDSIEQLRAIADALRIRIVEALQEHPMTVTQLGDALGEAPAKIHYHVRELEKVGLLKLVETREKSGILEKYYQPIARDFSVASSLFLRATPDESLAAIGAWFDQLKESFQRAFRVALEKKEDATNLMLNDAFLYLTDEEQRQLCQQVNELFKQYRWRRGIEGEQAILGTFITYPRDVALKAPQPANESASIRNIWMVGSMQFSRTDLEQVLAEGQRLHIHVTGICTFAKDISAELADSAIEQLQVIGKIEASPEVREVLERKRT